MEVTLYESSAGEAAEAPPCLGGGSVLARRAPKASLRVVLVVFVRAAYLRKSDLFYGSVCWIFSSSITL